MEYKCVATDCEEPITALTTDVKGQQLYYCGTHLQCVSFTKKGSRCTKKSKRVFPELNEGGGGGICGMHSKNMDGGMDVKLVIVKPGMEMELAVNQTRCYGNTLKGTQCTRRAFQFNVNGYPVCKQHIMWDGVPLPSAIVVPKPSFAITDVPSIMRIWTFSQANDAKTYKHIMDMIVGRDANYVRWSPECQDLFEMCDYLDKSGIPFGEILTLFHCSVPDENVSEDFLDVFKQKIIGRRLLAALGENKVTIIKPKSAGEEKKDARDSRDGGRDAKEDIKDIKEVKSPHRVAISPHATFEIKSPRLSERKEVKSPRGDKSLDEKEFETQITTAESLPDIFELIKNYMSLPQAATDAVESIYPGAICTDFPGVLCWLLVHSEKITSTDSFDGFNV